MMNVKSSSKDASSTTTSVKLQAVKILKFSWESAPSHLVSCYIVFPLVMTTDRDEQDEPFEYARLALEGNLQIWGDAEDSLEVW